MNYSDESLKAKRMSNSKSEDTSLDDIVIPDDIEQLCTYLFDQVQSYRTVEGWDGMFKIKDRVLAWHKAERAKLFEQIRSEVIKDYEDKHQDQTARVVNKLRAEQLEALTRLEQK